jgi:hypothetical protein
MGIILKIFTYQSRNTNNRDMESRIFIKRLTGLPHKNKEFYSGYGCNIQIYDIKKGAFEVIPLDMSHIEKSAYLDIFLDVEYSSTINDTHAGNSSYYKMNNLENITLTIL